MTAQIVGWFDGRTFTAAERSGVSAQVTDQEGVGGRFDVGSGGGFDRLLLLVLTHALSPHGRFLLHAAAVDSPGQVGVLGDSAWGSRPPHSQPVAVGRGVLDDDFSIVRSARVRVWRSLDSDRWPSRCPTSARSGARRDADRRAR